MEDVDELKRKRDHKPVPQGFREPNPNLSTEESHNLVQIAKDGSQPGASKSLIAKAKDLLRQAREGRFASAR